MSTLKTRPSGLRVADYLDGVDDPQRRADCRQLIRLLREETGKRATMWGDSLVGFGRYSYTTGSGHSGTWPITGCAARKRNLTVYIMPGFSGYGDLLARLGKHKTAKSCLYINRLSDVDQSVLRELVRRSVADMRARYDCR